VETNERLSGALQENILTLLVFDDKNCKVARGALTPQLFENAIYREIAGQAIDYVDTYGEAIKEHLPDQLEHILNGKGDDERKAQAYRRVLEKLFDTRDSINGDYVISQLHKFVRQQNLKSGIKSAVEAIEDGRIDDAEVLLQKGLSSTAVAFDAGFSLNSAADIASILDSHEEEGFTLGIPELDDEGIIPRRKELYMLMAARGRGKSWFLTHCAKQAVLQRWSCVIITLEMGERSYAARMLQSFFSIGKRKGEAMVTRFSRDRDGELMDMIQEQIERPALANEDDKEAILRRARREFKRRVPFRIKSFPMKALTVAGLRAYLDGLARFENFTPDVLLIDYPDLFATGKEMRIDLGNIVAELRGIGGERNCAVIAVSQGNRTSETAQTVTADMLAEDISKLAHADVLLTLSQTPAEKVLGLARLGVAKARNESGGFGVLITQAYAIGQFCLDSIRLGRDYWEMLLGKDPDGDPRDGGERDERDDRPRRGRNNRRD
jgi:hypothetical protein